MMNLRRVYNLAKSGEYWEYALSQVEAFFRSKADLFTGIVVEAGCGNQIFHSIDIDRCKYIGIDLSLSQLLKNDKVKLKVSADVGAMPLRDASVNLVVCKDLIEHLPNPEKLVKEASRILVPEGLFIIATPNLYGFTSLTARFLPVTLSKFVWRYWRKRKMPDFPFIYKANTARAFRRLASENSLEIDEIIYIGQISDWFRRIPIIVTMAYAYGEFIRKIRADLFPSCMIVILRKASKAS
jgi:SAM-dependent methyltransferase